MLTLYHGRTSVCSVKVRLALAEKGVDFDSRLMTLRGDQYEPAYKKLNPNAVVPTLVHDDKVIIESTVIMHYVDEGFPGPALMPADAFARSKLRMTAKLVDEYVHLACMALSFATASRARLAHLTPQELDARLAQSPDRQRAEVKREAVTRGLNARAVVEALHDYDKLLGRIEAAMAEGLYLAGNDWSLADAAATPYIWRLDKLKLARLWDGRPAIAGWYERIRARPSFKVAVEDWLSPADAEHYAGAPDPWPKVQEILRAA